MGKGHSMNVVSWSSDEQFQRCYGNGKCVRQVRKKRNQFASRAHSFKVSFTQSTPIHPKASQSIPKHLNPFQPISIHLKASQSISKYLNPFSKHLNLFQSISIHPKGKLVGGAEARARGQPWQTKGDWNPNLLFLNWTKTQNIKIKQKR